MTGSDLAALIVGALGAAGMGWLAVGMWREYRRQTHQKPD